MTRVEVIKKMLKTPKKWLTNHDWLVEHICEYGLHPDVLMPYGEGREQHIKQKGIWQHPDQYADFLIFLANRNIQTYLEIGVADGATLIFTTAYLKAVNKNFVGSVGVDVETISAMGLLAELEYFKVKLNISLVQGTSENIEDNYDLVFIDGDHSYKGVLDDWNNLQEHALEFCAFHDIDAFPLPEVRKAWEEISFGEHVTTFTGPEGVMGIGLVGMKVEE